MESDWSVGHEVVISATTETVSTPNAPTGPATAETAEHALLRPRFDGCIAFTNTASARIRGGLETGEDETRILATLRRLWAEARERARGDLDDARGPT